MVTSESNSLQIYNVNNSLHCCFLPYKTINLYIGSESASSSICDEKGVCKFDLYKLCQNMDNGEYMGLVDFPGDTENNAISRSIKIKIR